jgi:formate dehydrogenase
VQTGGQDGREIVRIRGDKAHPASQGYLCQKASGLNHYQNGVDRLTAPLRRRPDGSFEEIDWDTAISEVAEKLTTVRDQHGGNKIFYYGGGGQGNHLPGAYAGATRKVLGNAFRSNALAQEKTGEFWVNAQMFGSHVRGDFEHCDVAVFIGKNPWHSHGVPRARAWLRDFSKHPDKTMIVIDPVVSETAKLADIHLQVKPGTDAWLLAALVGMIVQGEKYQAKWLAEHSRGLDDVLKAFAHIPVEEYLAHAGIAPELATRAVDSIAGADGCAVFEDLGTQMNRHSTLVSYLEKLVWALCGHFGKPGGQVNFAYLTSIGGSGLATRKSPVVGAPIISGLVPCNVIADEILTDHPDRYRAMIVEAANPVHSLADSKRLAEALDTLECVVVIDIAMTETARHADYVLPVSTQYEKWEATFFNFEFPDNYFQLRKPLFDAPAGVLPEAEIHARLVEALGAMPTELCDELRACLQKDGRHAYRERFMQSLGEDPQLAAVAPVVLYRTLGPSLPDGAAAGAVLWPLCIELAMREPEAVSRAGFTGDAISAAEALFDAILCEHSGVVFARDDFAAVWKRLGHDGQIQLALPKMLEELETLQNGPEPLTSEDYPFILMAGERRDYSANTIYRDAGWRRKDRDGALRICSADAKRLGLVDGGQARITTRTGTALTLVEVNDRMQPGHVSLPNGFGLDNRDGGRIGVAPNELTSLRDMDKFAGTPWHKVVPAQIEAVA